jgi:hypothetical protein
MKMFSNRFLSLLCVCSILITTGALACTAQNNPVPRTPSDVVREFYKAMREHRFREAFAMTSYKPAVEGLNAEEMELLRPGFEEKAAAIDATVEITGEQISGDKATVFVKVPVTATTPQVTSQPLNLVKSGNDWIILFGSEADAAEVKKAGRRYLLDMLIEGHEADAEDFLKRLAIWEGIYSSQHNGVYSDFNALIQAGMFSNDVIDPKLSGYNYHITVAKDGKTYVAGAEPVNHGKTGKLSFWADQTGAIKSADNGGKPLKP